MPFNASVVSFLNNSASVVFPTEVQPAALTVAAPEGRHSISSASNDAVAPLAATSQDADCGFHNDKFILYGHHAIFVTNEPT